MIVGSARTKGLHQTELSKTLESSDKVVVPEARCCGQELSRSSALVAYVNHVMASPPPVSALPVEIYAVLFPVAFVFLLILFWRHNHSTYQQLYAQWNRSFICERCGAMSQHELPDNW